MAANIPQTYYGLTFPDYVFKPYPKWVTGADGKSLIVQSEDEEHRVLALAQLARDYALTQAPPEQASGLMGQEPRAVVQTPIEDPPIDKRVYLSAVEEKADLRAHLVAQAEERGVRIDKRWNNARIQKALEE